MMSNDHADTEKVSVRTKFVSAGIGSRYDGTAPTTYYIRFALWAAIGLLATAAMVAVAPSAKAATAPTVVSLTFDDALAEQKTAAEILHKHGLDGTFYINSGAVGRPHYFEHGDLTRLAFLGHELGGHTVSHPDLTTLPADDARREVCADRATLIGWGFRVTSFAYPYASYNRAIETIVQDCGYNSARKDGGIRRPGTSPESCPRCPVAETISPPDPYAIRTLHHIDTSWTLTDLKSAVTNAEDHGGGWVVLVFHHICDDHCPLSTSPAILDAFAAWLTSREARGTRVKTVDHVIGGPVKPIVTPASPMGHEPLISRTRSGDFSTR